MSCALKIFKFPKSNNNNKSSEIRCVKGKNVDFYNNNSKESFINHLTFPIPTFLQIKWINSFQ